MLSDSFCLEIGHFQKAKAGEYTFGDVVLKRFIKEENRRIVVLSDGMGSGIKANILATLTASMALNFVAARKSIVEASSVIFHMLPECSVRKTAYATFAIFDLTGDDTVRMMVYDSPRPALIRNGSEFELAWQVTELADTAYAGKSVAIATFQPQSEDRLFAFSDGVSQAGLGRGTEWRREGVIAYLLKSLREKPDYSAADLAERVVHKAELNDKSGLKDDATMVSVYFRRPRRLLIATGAPAGRERDFAFARRFADFPGKKAIAGGTTSEVIARELGLAFIGPMVSLNDGLPPISTLPTADLVTEGVMTLSRVERLLREPPPKTEPRDGAAERLVKLILGADRIEFLVGAAANEFHYNLQYKLRLQLIRDIVNLLETVYLKWADIELY